jgi:hypothetical protein
MVAGPAQFRLIATDSEGLQSAEACSLIVERGPLSISGCPLPDARLGEPYSALLGAVGGSAPYLFSTIGGSLPAGLSLSPTTGALTGTPTESGSFNFTFRLREAGQGSTIQACKLQVAAATLRLTTSCPLPDARVGEPYNKRIEVSGGTAPVTFKFGLLPDGLTGAADGTISGTPARLGGRTFSIQLTDANQQTAEAFCSLPVSQPNPPAISLVDPPATVAAAASNVSLGVQLGSAYTAPVRGQINLQVTPETSGIDPVVDSSDPLLAFANGQRTASFTIPAGSTRVNVPLVSTGTVASRVTVSLSKLEASGAPVAQTPSSKQFRLPPAAPSLTSACFDRTNTENGIQLNVRVAGFSNTRELTRAQVTVPGLQIIRPNLRVPPAFVFDSSDTVTVDVNGLAFGFFSAPANIRTGGAFSLTIPVPLDLPQAYLAPTAKLPSVSFNLFNGVGAAGARSINPCP